MPYPTTTPDDLRDLPLLVPLVQAGELLGIGRVKCYEFAQTGRFPIEVLKIANRLTVRKVDLVRYLGLPAEMVTDDQKGSA